MVMASLSVIFLLVMSGFILGKEEGHKKDSDHAEVLILGAGMAGIAAAKTLSENNIHNILILEGSNRVGGRIKEAALGNIRVEVGANWVAGTEGNPIWDLVEKYDISGKTTDYSDVVIRDWNGNDVTSDQGEAAWKKLEKAQMQVSELFKMKKAGNISDMSTRAALQLSGWFPRTPVEKVVEVFDYDFENSDPPEATSIATDDSLYGSHKHEFFCVRDDRGFSYVVTKMVEDLLASSEHTRLKMNQIVSKINYSDSLVSVWTEDNKVYTAEYVIVTFSLGVLQHGLVKFEPPLPLWKRESIFRHTMTDYFGVFLKFPENMKRFWDDAEIILYATKRRGYWSVWQNLEAHGLYPKGTNILEMVTFGEDSKRVDLMTDAEIQAELMDILRNTYKGVAIPDPEEILVPRWQSDPLFMGAFSNYPPGFRPKYTDPIQAPVGKVYFAGEAMEAAYGGYVHGAFISGVQNAQWILKCKKGQCRTFSEKHVTLTESSEEKDVTFTVFRLFELSAIVIAIVIYLFRY